MLFLHVTSAKAEPNNFKHIVQTLNFILLCRFGCVSDFSDIIPNCTDKTEKPPFWTPSPLCYTGLMPLTRLTELKLSSSSAGKVLQSFGSTSKCLHALLLVSCTTDVVYHMLLLNSFSSQPQSLWSSELVYCHAHFWALFSLLRTPQKSKRSEQVPVQEYVSTVCHPCVAGLECVQQDQSKHRSAGPSPCTLHICMQKWGLLVKETLEGALQRLDTAQEGKDDGQVMVRSWAVTNTNSVGSNILYELNLCFSAPEGPPSRSATKGAASSATHTDRAAPTTTHYLVSTRNSPLLRSIHQFPWTRALMPSAVILQTSMKTEMVKLKTFSYSNTPLCLQHPHCTEVVLQNLCGLSKLFPGYILQVQGVVFRTHLIRLKMIIDPYGFNRSAG